MEELSFEDIGTHVQAMDLDLRHNFKDRGKLFRARVVACFNALPPPAGPADSDERLPLWFTVVDRQRRSEDELRRDLTSLRHHQLHRHCLRLVDRMRRGIFLLLLL